MHPVFIQAFYYAVAMGLSVVVIAFLLRGFFWKFVKVKMSLGRLVLVKIRSKLRDHYKIGEVMEGNLEYKSKDRDGKKTVIRLTIPRDTYPFYKSIGVTWVDVDEEKNAIAKVNFESVSGFDAVKWNNLFIRALTRPTIGSSKEMLVLIALLIIGLAALAAVYFGYMNYKELLEIKTKILPSIIESLKTGATITPAPGI
jgi:hypothetical protein